MNMQPRFYALLSVVGILASVQTSQAQLMIPSTTNLNDLYQRPIISGLPQIVPVSSIEAPTEGESNEQIGFNSLANQRPWSWEAGLTGAWNYNTNIYAQPHGVADNVLDQSAFLQGTYGAPGAALNVSGRYVLGYNEYLNHSQYDGLTNDLSLNANWNPSDKTSFTSSLAFVQGRGTSLGAGVQNDTSSLVYNLGGRYMLDDKFSTGFNATAESLTEQTGGDYFNGGGSLFVDYQYDPKLRIGLLAGGEYRTYNGNEIDTNVGVNVNYQPTEKFGMNGSLCLGIRSYSGGSTEYPNVEIGCIYQPLDGTKISLSFYNTQDATFVSNSIQANTELGFTLGITQCIVQKVNVNVYGGYETNTASSQISYGGSSSGSNALFGGSITWNIFRRVNISVYSNALLQAYSGSNVNQVISGVQVAVTF